MSIHGLPDFREKMRRIGSEKEVKKFVRKASRQAMNLVRDDARINAKAIDDPETVAKIHKNITVQAGKVRDRNSIKMRVGIKGGAGQNQYSVSTAGLSGGDTRHWRFIEFGTSTIPAVPFMRPALAKNVEAVIGRFSQSFMQQLDEAIAAL
ncbi:HK97-gp10 family putative phage morphogenesis protein [Acinetobacter guillouiae]|uniref:HK97-gp10 family putative phage morphogenesis protein n=1 Tax=Acinetobacter guillouiae TaxID=106649 RepID=UPI0028EEB02E|nr:HK97-gp10 family putative phage morphogenesis protein [Acinetobacter guillouiae]